MTQINELIEHLRGTCLSETQAVGDIYGETADNFGDLPDKDLQQLDDAIFCCAGCNWWCDIDEAHDDGGEDICLDCAQERGLEEG